MALETTEQLLSLVERSRLLKPAVLDKALATISAESGKLPSDPNVLLQKLIDAKLITPWQADKLQEGRYKGFLLGNYKLLGHLGTGGMSSVYLAEHIHMQRRAAIKVLPQNRVDDSSYLERFYLEARATAVLNHRNIVKVYDVDSDGNNHFIVMEFVDGYDLQELVEHSRPLPPATAVEYIRQAAEGLAHAHEAGMVHRDIKPANLLVTEEGTIKILDMGLARFDDETEASLTLAHGENVLGTADYLAPEQALNSHDVDGRADIYSLGCTMYFLLTGQPPFPEGTLTQRLMKHQTEQPKSILAIRPDVPTDLVAICNKMMAKSPDNRFESAGIVSETMGRWLLNHGKTLNTGSTSDPSSIRLAALLDKQEIGSRKRSGSGIAGRSGKRFGRFLPPPGSSITHGSMLPERETTGDTASGHNRDTVKGPVDPSRRKPVSLNEDELLEMKPLDEGEVRPSPTGKPQPLWTKPDPEKDQAEEKQADKKGAVTKPAAGKTAAGESAARKPATGQPGAAKPPTGKSGVASPGGSAPKAGTPQRAGTKPATPAAAKPGTAKQGPAKHGPTGHGPGKQVGAKPATSRPAPTASGPTKQRPPQAGPATPGHGKPGQGRPAQAGPATGKSGPARPGPVKPGAAKPTASSTAFPELEDLFSSDLGASTTGKAGGDLLGQLGAQADAAPPKLPPIPLSGQRDEPASVMVPLLVGISVFALVVLGVVIGWTLAN